MRLFLQLSAEIPRPYTSPEAVLAKTAITLSNFHGHRFATDFTYGKFKTFEKGALGSPLCFFDTTVDLFKRWKANDKIVLMGESSVSHMILVDGDNVVVSDIYRGKLDGALYEFKTFNETHQYNVLKKLSALDFARQFLTKYPPFK